MQSSIVVLKLGLIPFILCAIIALIGLVRVYFLWYKPLTFKINLGLTFGNRMLRCRSIQILYRLWTLVLKVEILLNLHKHRKFHSV